MYIHTLGYLYLQCNGKEDERPPACFNSFNLHMTFLKSSVKADCYGCLLSLHSLEGVNSGSDDTVLRRTRCPSGWQTEKQAPL